METFLTFSMTAFNGTGINIRFIDSYKHLTYPIDCLVNYLFNKDTNTQPIKTKFPSLFQHFNDETVKLLRNWVYSYDYIDEDWENKLKQKELPDIKYFHSSLNNAKCLADDYNHAKQTYNYFGFEEISDYNDLHLITDLILLADVFIAYRKKMYNVYGLDPDFTNWAILKMKRIEIRLIANLNIHLMIENRIRGGRYEPIYYHARANNKYVNPNFDTNKEKRIIHN